MPLSAGANSEATGTTTASAGRRRESTVSVIQICRQPSESRLRQRTPVNNPWVTITPICSTPAVRNCSQHDASVLPVSRMSSTMTAWYPGDPMSPRCSTPVDVRRWRAQTIGRSTPAACASAEHRSDRPLVRGYEGDILTRGGRECGGR